MVISERVAPGLVAGALVSVFCATAQFDQISNGGTQ